MAASLSKWLLRYSVSYRLYSSPSGGAGRVCAKRRCRQPDPSTDV